MRIICQLSELTPHKGGDSSRIVVIFCPDPNKRVVYILKQIFEDWLGLSPFLITEKNAYLSTSLPSINYSRNRLKERECFIPASGWLREGGLDSYTPECVNEPGLPLRIFPVDQPDADLSIDYPSMCFFFLSRYEEYQPSYLDSHERFPAELSFSKKANILRVPILDYWLMILHMRLKEHNPSLQLKEGKFNFQPTYDIDYPWAYLYKPFFNQIKSYVRILLSGNVNELSRKIKVMKRKTTDPFFTFQELKDLHHQHGLEPIYFFLMADPGQFDKNPSWKLLPYRNLISNIHNDHKVGIHPSYYANLDYFLLCKEKERLEKITGSAIYKSRQHFIRLNVPETYRLLIKAGIKEDYSMGYPEEPGFRAGTSRAFRWYDIEKEETTELIVYPFQIMDGSLKNYLKLQVVEAKAIIREINDHIHKTKGTFRSLWHNSSFSSIGEWEDWKEVYDYLINHVAETIKK